MRTIMHMDLQGPCIFLSVCQLVGQNSTIYFYFALLELLGEKFLRHLENKLLSFMLKYFLPVCPSCPVPQVSHMFGIDWSCVPGTCAKCLHVLLLLILSSLWSLYYQVHFTNVDSEVFLWVFFLWKNENKCSYSDLQCWKAHLQPHFYRTTS